MSFIRRLVERAAGTAATIRGEAPSGFPSAQPGVPPATTVGPDGARPDRSPPDRHTEQSDPPAEPVRVPAPVPMPERTRRPADQRADAHRDHVPSRAWPGPRSGAPSVASSADSAEVAPAAFRGEAPASVTPAVDVASTRPAPAVTGPATATVHPRPPDPGRPENRSEVAPPRPDVDAPSDHRSVRPERAAAPVAGPRGTVAIPRAHERPVLPPGRSRTRPSEPSTPTVTEPAPVDVHIGTIEIVASGTAPEGPVPSDRPRGFAGHLALRTYEWDG